MELELPGKDAYVFESNVESVCIIQLLILDSLQDNLTGEVYLSRELLADE